MIDGKQVQLDLYKNVSCDLQSRVLLGSRGRKTLVTLSDILESAAQHYTEVKSFCRQDYRLVRVVFTVAGYSFLFRCPHISVTGACEVRFNDDCYCLLQCDIIKTRKSVPSTALTCGLCLHCLTDHS
jgi:hypothetical protein